MACVFLPASGFAIPRKSCIVSSVGPPGTSSFSAASGSSGNSSSISISTANAFSKPSGTWQSKNRAVKDCIQVLKQGIQMDTEEHLARYQKYLNSRVISLVIQNTRNVDAALFFFRWVARELKDVHSNFTCGSMLRSLVRAGRIQEADKFFTEEVMLTGLCKPDIVHYNMLIGALCKAGHVERANTLLEEMKQKGLAPDVVTHAAFVQRLCESGCVNEAIEYVRKMECEPDFLMVNGLMKALCKENRLPQAQSFLEEMARRGLANVTTCNILMDAYCQSGAVETACGLLGTGLCKPDIMHYNTLIGALGKAGNLERANTLLEEMKQKGVSADVVTHTTFLKRLCESGCVNEALEYMRKMECEPNSVMVNGLMNTLCKEKYRLPQAHSFLDEMAGRGLADAVTYNILMDAYCQSGAVENARGLLDTMIERDCKPDLVSFSTLIHSYCKIGCAGTAYRFMDQMQQLGIEPNVVTYTGLISGFCQNGRIDRAREVLTTMKDKGCTPNSVTYGVLLNHLCKDEKKIEEIDELVKEMSEKRVAIDRGTLNTLIVMYCSNNRIEHALKMRDEMAERCLIPDEGTYTSLIIVLAKEGRSDEAAGLLDEMLKMGFVPSGLVLQMVLESLVSSEKLDEAMQLLRITNPVGICAKLITGLCDQGRAKDALKLLRDSKSKGAEELPVSCYEAVIKSLVDAGEESEAMAVFEDVGKDTSYQISELVTRLKEVKRSSRRKQRSAVEAC